MGNQERKPGGRRRCALAVLLGIVLFVTASADADPAEPPGFEALRQAADLGSVMDQAVLGNLYLHGTAVPRDFDKAFHWLDRAAQQGGAPAQHDLGYMYYNGHGVARDHHQAMRWYRKAAVQGFGPSQLGLGVMYALGQGVPQDYVLAHKWAHLAAAHMDPSEGVLRLEPGQREAAMRYRDAVAVHMTREQVEQARRLADAWQQEAAQRGR